MELAVINQRIGAIRRGTKQRRTYVQDTLVGIVEHAREHGDCSAAARLVRALATVERGDAIKWFGLVSPINVTMGATAKDDKARFRKEEQKGYNPFNIDRARALEWWTVESPPRPAKVYDVTSFREDIAAVIKRYRNKMKEDGFSENEAREIMADIQRLGIATEENAHRLPTPVRQNDGEGNAPAQEAA